jgi:hypothetical protein
MRERGYLTLAAPSMLLRAGASQSPRYGEGLGTVGRRLVDFVSGGFPDWKFALTLTLSQRERGLRWRRFPVSQWEQQSARMPDCPTAVRGEAALWRR